MQFYLIITSLVVDQQKTDSIKSSPLPHCAERPTEVKMEDGKESPGSWERKEKFSGNGSNEQNVAEKYSPKVSERLQLQRFEEYNISW